MRVSVSAASRRAAALLVAPKDSHWLPHNVPPSDRLVDWAEAPPADYSSSPDCMPSQISLHSGQTGNRSGSRLGTQTFPHKATTGVPITMASVNFSFGT